MNLLNDEITQKSLSLKNTAFSLVYHFLQSEGIIVDFWVISLKWMKWMSDLVLDSWPREGVIERGGIWTRDSWISMFDGIQRMEYKMK